MLVCAGACVCGGGGGGSGRGVGGRQGGKEVHVAKANVRTCTCRVSTGDVDVWRQFNTDDVDVSYRQLYHLHAYHTENC